MLLSNSMELNMRKITDAEWGKLCHYLSRGGANHEMWAWPPTAAMINETENCQKSLLKRG